MRPPIHASGETASEPYASDVHTEWNPHRSASSARPTQNDRIVVSQLQAEAHATILVA